MRILLIFVFSLYFLALASAQTPVSKGGKPLVRESQTLVLKLKENTSLKQLKEQFNSLSQADRYIIKQAHPHNQLKSKRKDLKLNFGLDRIYKITIPDDKDISVVKNRLEKLDIVEYAEPYRQMELLYIPNDTEASPLTGRQNHLDLIKAYDAWEIEKGDSTILIGILDTGVKLNHEDLKPNVFLNAADPINGIDDDNDGFTDNYYGWDFADEDNDPSDVHNHGTQVTGIASARTSNAIGIAATGFNSKFMPIKVYSNVGTAFYNGYEAILYAALKGCKVINLSWGSPESYNRYEEDIINTVVLDMDVVIVAAAGNSNINQEFYPASYENVLSVGNTLKDGSPDEKSPGSTFSPFIDISAPGTNVYTTSGSGYGGSTGTSLSSPAVAGAAALVRARFPELNALQVMERLRVTADDIYHLSANYQYKELLGKGRLNMYRALVDSTSSAVRFRDISYDNGIGKIASYEDTVSITGNFVNYLKEVNNLKVTLSIESDHIELIDSVVTFSKLHTLIPSTANFKFYIKPTLPPGERLRFRLGFEGDNYSDYQYFDINTLPDYYTVTNGNLAMTIGSNGNLGYNSDNFNDGIGIIYKDDFILDFASLLIAKNQETISDNMFNSYYTLKREKDFRIEKSIKIEQDNDHYVKASSSFSDLGIPTSLGLHINQSLSAHKQNTSGDFLLLDYRIKNTSGSRHDSLKVGLYFDWDIVDSMNNYSGFDPEYNLGYVYYPENKVYAGVALLSDQPLDFTPISLYNDNWDFVFGSAVSEAEKHSLLQHKPPYALGPVNIAATVSATLYGIENEAETDLHFVITAGESVAALKNNIREAQLLKPFVELPLHEICEGENITIDPGLDEEVFYYSDSLFINLIGQGDLLSVPAPITLDNVYIKTADPVFYKKFKAKILVHSEMKADFTLPSDSIYFNEVFHESKIQLFEESNCVVRREWSINGVVVSDQPDPVLSFHEGGDYEIKLKVWNKTNRTDSVSHTLVVDYLTGIQDVEEAKFKFYPNPVSSILKIEIPSEARGKENVVLSVYDQPGRLVLQKTLQTTTDPAELDVSGLPAGLYIIKAATRTENTMQKILIQ